MPIQFAHINLIARDWRRLAAFYMEIFGCEAVPPERDLDGKWLDAATGLSSAHIRGVHLRLPGTHATLEIFTYDEQIPQPLPTPNREGFGHIAFHVDNVAEVRGAVLARGGSTVGEIVAVEIAGGPSLAFCYVRDPEGNLIELQRRM